MISVDVIGMAYTLLLFVLTFFQVKSGNPIDGGLAYFEFYGDKVCKSNCDHIKKKTRIWNTYQ